MDELRRLYTPSIYAEEGAHAHPLAGGPVEDAKAEPRLSRDGPGRLCETRRRHAVRRLVDEVSREAGRLGGQLGAAEALAHRREGPRRWRQDGDGGHRAVAVPLLLVPIEPVEAEPHALGGRLGPAHDAQAGSPGPKHRNDDTRRPEVSRSSRRGGRRPPE